MLIRAFDCESVGSPPTKHSGTWTSQAPAAKPFLIYMNLEMDESQLCLWLLRDHLRLSDFGERVTSSSHKISLSLPPIFLTNWWDKTGRALENGTPEFSNFIAERNITTIQGTRSIILVDVHQVGSSCGFSVPTYEFKDFRPLLNDHFMKKELKFKSGKKEEALDRWVSYFLFLFLFLTERLWVRNIGG